MAWPGLVANVDRVCLNHLGIPVLYSPAVGSDVTIQAIFDNAYERIDAGNPGFSTQVPMIFCRVSDLPADPLIDDPDITIDGTVYRVVEVQKDGQGGCRLFLHKAS